ncbi:SulP family inorganic anion transporter [Pontiellaceae bacterium B12227]|nr:SulP family inorganic anion transporter [Pontiellaceae bacterium B12227]
MRIFSKKLFPFLSWFPAGLGDLRADLLAGLTVALVLIPQSMAYAELAGLPVWAGLYAAFIPVILGGLWGSSNHLQTGPGATMGLIVAAVLMPLAAAGSAEYVKLAVQLGFMVGVIWSLVAIFRLGFIINFLSRPVIEGFINAGGILIAVSQVGKILGIPLSRSDHMLGDMVGLISRLGAVNPISLLIGGVSLMLLLGGRRFFPKVPMALIIASLATAAVYYLGLSDPERTAYPLAIVGNIPAGLPKPAWPVPDLGNTMKLLPGALIFAFVGFMETCSVARGIAARSHQKLNVNQEAVGQALASFGAAFSGGQPINGSFSRSALNFASGARSGLAAVFTGLFVLIFLLVCTPLFYFLPKTVLAAIIIAAVIKLMNFRQLASFMKVTRADGVAAWVTFAGTLVFAPALEKGILLGASVSIFMHLYKMMRPHIALLGRRADGKLEAVDVRSTEVDRNLPAIRLDGRLFFANAAYFEDQVHGHLEQIPESRNVAIIFDGINEIDSSGTEMLKELTGQLGHKEVQLIFVGVKPQVREVLVSSGLVELVGRSNFFGTYGEAYNEVIARMPSDMSFSI